MRFLSPALFLAWAPLVLVPLVLYLFRPRPRTVPTSTLPFFQRLARHYQDSTWLRRLKHLISLVLSLLVVVGAAAALARLVLAPPAQSLKTVVVLVDRSASMAAQSDGGPTRLAAAQSLAERRLSSLPAGVGVVVMAYDCRPEVMLSRSTDPRQVQRALAAIRTRPIAGDAEAALRLARRLAALETPAAVWHFTARAEICGAGVPPALEQQGETHGAGVPPALGQQPGRPHHKDLDPQDDVTVEHVSLALPEPVNVGITAFELRRLPLELGHFEAFVEIHSAAAAPAATELEMRLDDKLVSIRKLVIPPRGKESLLVPLEADAQADRVLTLKVSTPGDMLAADNVLAARVPKLRPLGVLWISPSPDPFTELALSSLGMAGELEVLHGGPAAWPPKKMPDVAVLDGWLPPEWPQCPAVIVVNPPGALGPVRAVRLAGAGLPLDSLRAIDRGHPLLYGVATGRVALTQTAVVEAAGPLESVWMGPQGPVLVAGESHGQRVVVMAFSPQKSEHLPLLASYPLLVGNAIFWTAQNRLEAARGMNRRTGELVPLEGASLVWREAENPTVEQPAVERGGSWTELDRIGLWETDAGESGSAALLSASETLLAAADAQQADEEVVAASVWRGDLSPAVLWGILAVLVGESWLFHRLLAY